MRYPKFLLSLLCLCLTSSALADDAWQSIESPVTTELRGLSVVNQQIAWASGAKGTVLRTLDGQNWQQLQVDHAAAGQLDFRAIKAFDAYHAYLMSAGPGTASKLFVTQDGGQHWQLLTSQDQPTGFWNAMVWSGPQQGLLFGDPLNQQFELKHSLDAGKSWQTLRHPALQALAQEGAFAASGTCIQQSAGLTYFVSGGASHSRIFIGQPESNQWFSANLPLAAAAPSKGAFSVLFLNPLQALVVGGDYQQAHLAGINAARSNDGGKSWQALSIQPQGFYSVVAAVPGEAQVAVAGGLAGISWTKDAGLSWQALSQRAVNTVAFSSAKDGWAIGPKGLILKYRGPALTAR